MVANRQSNTINVPLVDTLGTSKRRASQVPAYGFITVTQGTCCCTCLPCHLSARPTQFSTSRQSSEMHIFYKVPQVTLILRQAWESLSKGT